MSVTVDAFLVHWQAPEWCAESVQALLASEGVDVRVTVINNGGQLDLPSGVRVVDQPRNRGFAAGANAGLDLARPGLVFVGCHDVRLAPDALVRMAAMLESDSGLGIVGPVLDGGGSQERDLEWVSGAGMLLRSEVAERFRFDERFGSYVEDVDFCVRVRIVGGWRVGRSNGNATTRGTSAPESAKVLMTANMIAFHRMHHRWGPMARGLRDIFVDLALAVARRESAAVRRAGKAILFGLWRSVTIRRRDVPRPSGSTMAW